MLRNLREIMGLTIEQVAEELSITPDQVINAEEVNDREYSRLFFNVFPLNRRILYYPDADPFLPSYDQTSPGKRLETWMIENRMSASKVAEMLDVEVADILEFIAHSKTVSKEQGEEIQRKIGINRKWLMYGDGRNKGNPIYYTSKENEIEKKSKTLLEKMYEDFEKLPNERILSSSEIKQERKEWGKKVREARKNANLSLKGMADVLGLSASRIGQMECGIITEKQAKEILLKLTAFPKNSNDSADHIVSVEKDVISEKCILNNIEPSSEIKNDSKAIGNIIRENRKKVNLTIKEMAGLLGLSVGRISQMECGMISKKQSEDVLHFLMEYSEQKKSILSSDLTGKADSSKPTIPDGVYWGREMKKARKKAGFSQKMLGDLIGKSHATISLMEKGKVSEETAKYALDLLEKYSM